MKVNVSVELDWIEEDGNINEVDITDKWGDVKTRSTIKDVIKASFDRLLEKDVNSKGEFTDGRYGRGNTKLITWLAGGKVQEVVAEKLKTLNKDIDAQITAAVNDGIRKNVSDKFAEMVVSTAHHNNKTKQLEHDG